MVVSSVCQVVGSFSCVLHGLVRFLEGLKTRFMRALKVLRVYRLSRGFRAWEFFRGFTSLGSLRLSNLQMGSSVN